MFPTPAELRGWIPFRIAWEGGEPVVTWRPVGPARFTEPFFDDTLRAAASDPAVGTLRIRTPVAVLHDVANESDGRRGPVPAGFIFHWSRCGSTLLARLLAASPDHLMLSEAPPVDAVLLSHLTDARTTAAWQVATLQSLVAALGRALPDRRRLFIKFDGWHILQWPLIRAAFPQVPWVFVYRDPLEVLVSHGLRCGSQMVPGRIEPALFGWDPAEVVRRPFAVHQAQVLAALGRAGADAVRQGGGRLVNYAELPEAGIGPLLRFFGVPSPMDLGAAMRAAAQLHAKEPETVFTPDSIQKRARATSGQVEAVGTHAAEVYAGLEALRRAGFGLAPSALAN